MDKKRPKRSGCVYLVNLTPSLECWSFALSRLHIWRSSLLHTWGRLHTWQSAPFQAAQTNDKQWFVEETWLEVTTHLWGQKRWSLMFLESSAQWAQPILRSLLKWSLRREASRSFSCILSLCCCLRNIQFTASNFNIHWGSVKHHDIICLMSKIFSLWKICSIFPIISFSCTLVFRRPRKGLKSSLRTEEGSFKRRHFQRWRSLSESDKERICGGNLLLGGGIVKQPDI